MRASTGLPWLSALHAVGSSTGFTATAVITSPPVIVTCCPYSDPCTGTVFRKWTNSWAWLAATYT